jgi:DnaJ-domain-containing protein 1
MKLKNDLLRRWSMSMKNRFLSVSMLVFGLSVTQVTFAPGEADSENQNNSSFLFNRLLDLEREIAQETLIRQQLEAEFLRMMEALKVGEQFARPDNEDPFARGWRAKLAEDKRKSLLTPEERAAERVKMLEKQERERAEEAERRRFSDEQYLAQEKRKLDALFVTLGLSPTATNDEIKTAYRKLALQHHPDKGGDVEKFKIINKAYQALKDCKGF